MEPEIHCSWFGSIIVSNIDNGRTSIRISDRFLERTTIAVIQDVILDVCATHTSLLLISHDFIYKCRIDDIEELKRSSVECLVFDAFCWESVSVELGVPRHVELVPSRVREFPERLLVSCSDKAFLIVNENGTSYIKRIINEASVLPSAERDKPSVIQCEQDMHIIQAAAGVDHCVFLEANGDVYSMGTGSRGELGVPEMGRNWTPVLSLEACRVTKVAAGAWHTVVLNEDGDVYVWGWNHTGQLGADMEQVEALPVLVDIEEKVVDVAAWSNLTRLWTAAKDKTLQAIDYGTLKRGKPCDS